MRYSFTPYIFPVGALSALALAAAMTCLAASDGTRPVHERATAASASAYARVAPSSDARVDADADFVAMMVPHHERAIEIAQAELRFGRDEALRGIARETIAASQAQIAALQLARAQARPAAGPRPEVLSDASEARPRADSAQ